jgi:hypothetical protein
MAVKSSLRYFCEVLEPEPNPEDDDGIERDD